MADEGGRWLTDFGEVSVGLTGFEHLFVGRLSNVLCLQLFINEDDDDEIPVRAGLVHRTGVRNPELA
jgi:hypothetical protein